jgi:hypothetical protein
VCCPPNTNTRYTSPSPEEINSCNTLTSAPGNAKILYPGYSPEVITYSQGQCIYACIVSGIAWKSSSGTKKVLLDCEAREPDQGLKGSLEHLLSQTQKFLGEKPQFLQAAATPAIVPEKAELI